MFCLYLAFLGVSSVFGFHVHHSAHEDETFTHVEAHQKLEKHLKSDRHCEQHCRLETLLEHAFDESAVLKIVEFELSPTANEARAVTDAHPRMISLSSPSNETINNDRSWLKFSLQPQAPPYI